MSKVTETIRVQYQAGVVANALRNLAMKTMSPFTETGDVFTIKLKTKFSLFKSGVPATVTLELSESKKISKSTVIKLTSANLGWGPLQVRECRTKLEALKEALMAELKASNKMVTGKSKTCKSRKLKRKKYNPAKDYIRRPAV